MFLFLLFLHFHSCSSFFPVPLFHLLYSLLSLFSLSLGDDTKWPSRVDVSLNPNTIKKKFCPPTPPVGWSALPLGYIHVSNQVIFKPLLDQCSGHEVPGLNPTGGRIQLMTVWHLQMHCFILHLGHLAPPPPIPPSHQGWHCLLLSHYDLNNVDKDVKHKSSSQPQQIIFYFFFFFFKRK